MLTKSFSVRLRALPSLRDLSGHAVIEFAQIHPSRSQSDKLRAPAEKRGFPCAFYYFYFSRKIFCADKIFFREVEGFALFARSFRARRYRIRANSPIEIAERQIEGADGKTRFSLRFLFSRKIFCADKIFFRKYRNLKDKI